MSLSAPFIQRPVATVMLMVALGLLGLLGYQRLPIAPLPEVDYPTIQVRTGYPGADPGWVESRLTAPLEKQLGQIAGLRRLSSSSGYGLSLITLSFDLGLDLDGAEQQVQSALYNASTLLPQDLPTPPLYFKSNPADAPVLTLILKSPHRPLERLQDLAETRLIQRLSQIQGVGVVDSKRGLRPAIHIRLDPRRLAASGLTIEKVRSSLLEASLNQAKGSFDGEKLALVIEANDQLMTVEDYRNQIIRFSEQSPIRLGDLGEVIEAPENPDQATFVNGVPAVLLEVHRQPGANTLALVDRIRALIPALEESLPADVELSLLADRSKSIRASIDHVERELLVTTGLVVLVLLLFLKRPWLTLIPALSIPLSLAGTFALMKGFGFSLNNLTLMALTIATGFVVDDAIVMLENIVRYLERGLKPLEAALRGAEEIGFTILSLSFALLATLIPLIFMPDLLGRLFREFALTLALAIGVSAVIALSLTPMLAARLRRSALQSSHDRGWLDALIAAYRRSLSRHLDHPRRIHLIFLVTLGLTVSLALLIPKGFFPEQDSGLLSGISETDPGLGFEAQVKRQLEWSQLISTDPDVETVLLGLGIEGSNTVLSRAQFLVELKPRAQRASSSVILKRLRDKGSMIPGTRLRLNNVTDLSLGDTLAGAPYVFSVTGLEVTALRDLAPRLTDALQRLPALREVVSDGQSLQPTLSLGFDRDSAARLGISTRALFETLYDAYGTRHILNRLTQSNQYRVILEVDSPFREDPRGLDSLYLLGNGGGEIPLNTLIRSSVISTPTAISRVNQRPSLEVGFDLQPGYALGEAISAVDRELATLHTEPSFEPAWLGTAEAFLSAFEHEWPLLIAAVIAVYLLLGMLYESYVHPLTILSTLPSAAFGGLVMLWALDGVLDVVALIGFVLLIGLVAKNAIMMIDFALSQMRDAHRSTRLAIEEAAVQRFRPILMTSLAAALAGVPLALGGGVGEELRRPLGLVMIGGLLFSQWMTLYTTPILFVTFDRLRQRIGRGGPLTERQDGPS